jgi:broad specificity phosphatase PhoE
METLLFIRHAQTDLAGRFCGHSNPPVNEAGQRQIEEMLKILKTESIDAVYTSDLARAFATADAIGRTVGCSPVTVPGFREICFGEWEGLSWSEIESRDPDYARQWSDAYPQLAAPGGEPFEAFQTRVLAEVQRILAITSERCAAVVTHAGVMRVVLRSLCGAEEREAWDRTGTYCGFFRYQLGCVS